MANEFIARKGLISLSNAQITGSVTGSSLLVAAKTSTSSSVNALSVSGSAAVPRVGIGLTDSTKALSVVGDISGSGNLYLEKGNYLYFGGEEDTQTSIRESNNNLRIEADDDILMYPDDDLKIGVGGTQYAYFYGDEKKFHIEGSVSSSTAVTSSFAALLAAGSAEIGTSATIGGNIELGHASDTTLARASSGDVNIEGNIIYRAGGTDVAVADGGTGASSLTQNGVLIGNGTSAVTAVDLSTDGVIVIGDGSGNPTTLDVGASGGITILGTIATGVWNGTAVASAYLDSDTMHLSVAQDVTGLKTHAFSKSGTSDPTNNILLVLKNTDATSNNYGALMWKDAQGNDASAVVCRYVNHANNESELGFWTRVSGGAVTQAMTIDSSQRVGIGTSSPTAELHVSASAAAQSLLHVEGNLGVDAMFVSSSGNVGIGTDSPKIRQYSVWPRLEVTNDASGSVVPDDVRIYLNNPTGSSSAFASLTFGNDSAGIAGAVFQNSSTNSSGYGGVNSLNVINVTSGDLALGTNNSVDMTIANGGNVTFVAGAVIGGTTYIGDTANANATLGLTINQGSADNQIFALKSSDVAHGLTSYGGMNTETDDFFSIQKESATLGGAKLQATAEDGATSTVLNFWSAGGTADTTKSTSGLGLVNFYITEHDGSNGRANITADGNVFSVSAYVGGAFATRWILDEDGDTWQAGNITIPATSKIYLDGGADTYIHENSTNSIQVVAGGSIAATFQAGGMFVPATDKIWFDSGADTYIHEVSADKLDVVVGGQTILEIAEGGGGASDYVAIQALNKLYLDGGGNTYISETSGDTMKFYAGGTEMWRLTSTYAYTEGHLAIDSGKKFYLDGISDTYFYQYADNNVRLICGTVDALSIGSNGIVFNEDSQDWDFRIESNDNANMFTINGGTNRIGMGVAAASTKAVHMGGTYGAVSGDANIGLYANWAITGTPNEDIVGVRLSPQMTEAGSGTHTNIFGLQVSPGLTGAGAAVSNTAALYVAGAMSGGSNNYALWVDAGAVLFDSTLHVGGALTVTDGSHINATGNVEIDGDIICSEYIYHKADTDTYQRFTTNAWLVRTGGDDRLTIDSNGIVRLGSNGSTAVGTQKAIVSANSVTSRANWQLNIEGDNDAGIVFSEDGTARGHVGYDAGLVATVLGDHANSTRFQTAYSADSASIYIDDNEAFRVTKGVSSGGIYADNATSPHRVEVNTHNIHEAKEGHAITGSAMTVVGNSATDWATGVSDLFLMTPSNDTGKGFQLGFGGGTTTAGATEKYGMIRSEIVNRGNGTAQGDLIFSTYGSGAEQEGFRIDHQGYVGFGVTAPAHKLDIGGMADPVVRIKSDSGGDPKLIFDAAAANRNGMIKFYDNGATAGGFIDYVHNGDKMNFGAGSSTTVNFVVGDGLVEVEKQLHIAQNNAVTSPSSGDNDALISIGADTFVGSASMTLKQNGLYVNSAFTTGATVGNVNQVAINSPGITETGGACTTAASLYVEGAPSAGTNNYALYVDGGNNRFDGSCYFGGDTAQRDHGQASYPVTINYTGSSNQGAAWYDHVTDTSSRYAIWFKRYYNSSWATVGSISTANSSTAYNTSSDYRMKENVVTLTGATARLKQLKPYRFNFKEQWGPADDVKDGFLAHEVAEVVPQAVHGEKDAVDEDGNPDMQGVDTSHLVPLLVATIQELEERITALEAGS